MNKLAKRGYETMGTEILPKSTFNNYIQINIINEKAVHEVITFVKPSVVIHCATWTAVDAAENKENKPKVYTINVSGTKHIAEACKETDYKMVYISTNYVFDDQDTENLGLLTQRYKPFNYYGLTKLERELVISGTLEKYFIVRIAWGFGLNGKNFIKTMINIGKVHEGVRVFNDQIGTPTYTYGLARLLMDM